MKLLVVIPYRNRQEHLSQIIPYLHTKLKDQKILYTITVIEQNDSLLFNRGLLCNIGFDIFNYGFDYVCFHDVDMLCDKIDYSFSELPVCLIKNRTKVEKICKKYFGGIVLFPNKKFIEINGFSNKYWGWGAEDDDLRERCKIKNIDINRRNGSCTDLETVSNNTNRTKNPNYINNLKILHLDKTLDTIKSDGLSTIQENYKLLSINRVESNYFHVRVNLCKK